MTELKIGSQGAEVFRWYDYFTRWAKSYAHLLGPRDGYYGNDEARFTSELQRRLEVPITGRFGDLEANRTGYRWTGTSTPPPAPAYRKIWLYSSPGSGGNWYQGPSFDLGERCKDVLHINHQPVSFQMGGYLGFMGGDPTYSYIDVTYDQYKSLEWLLDHNPDIDDPDLELWFSGYSQSADGLEDALEILFGDGGFRIPKTGEIAGPGKYRHLRSRINGVVQFGNPSTKGTGIARKVRPAWLDALIRNVNYDNDFYAKVPASDKIRPAMYAIIIEAEMELPFFVHVLRLAARIIPEWLGPFGGMLGPFSPVAQMAVAGMAGLNAGMPLLGSMFGMAGSDADQKVDDDLYNLLTPTGVLSNIPGLIGLIGALPGLQAHGGYPFDPVMMDRAYDHIAGFRR